MPLTRPVFPAAAILIAGLLTAKVASAAAQATLTFSGYTWDIRQAGDGGPGPNHWDPANAWVDGSGALHLKIANVNGQWTCAEVSTTRSFGFGTYQFEVEGRIDQLDPNVVLGLFDYPPPAVGPDGTNEIDIEFSRWGNANAPIGNYTVFPARANLNPPSATKAFNFSLTGAFTTQVFARHVKSVQFSSFYGFDTRSIQRYAGWSYGPKSYLARVPQQPTPAHINLWLVGGKPPTCGQPVEIIIKRFTFHAGKP